MTALRTTVTLSALSVVMLLGVPAVQRLLS